MGTAASSRAGRGGLAILTRGCLFLALGCGASPEATRPFTCEGAAAALNHPDATVSVCSEMVALPGVFSVMLDAGADGFVSRVVVTDVDGAVIEPGHAGAATAWLRRHEVSARHEVELGPLVHALHSLGAVPAGYGPDQVSESAPGVGLSELQREPLRVVLVRRVVSSGGSAGGRGAPRYERAVLQGEDGPWRLERHDGTLWQAVGEWRMP